MRLVILCPHFAPDTAPTGTVMTRIVHELVALGHEIHVVTSLPWYRAHAIEPGWAGKVIRREATPWGTITRVHPFPGADKSNLARRAAGFLLYSALAGVNALRVGPHRKVDAVIAMSPPLTLGLTGWLAARLRGGAMVFNIQDVFPDAALRTGAITNGAIIAIAELLERISYRRADAVTVLSDDLRENVAAKLVPTDRGKVRVIPNFVDTEAIAPQDRMTPYRTELGLGAGTIVLYAGNVGFSQSLELLLDAAGRLPDVTFLINGDGAARPSLEHRAAGLANVCFADYVEPIRLPELLATGDIHVVPLRAGLGSVSVPSKSYSIMAAGRPVIASIDPGTAIPRILGAAGAGIAVPPDDSVALVGALRALRDDPVRAQEMGAAGRRWVVDHASPGAVGAAYDALLDELTARPRPPGRAPGR